MRHLGIVSFAVVLSAILVSTPADSAEDEALPIVHLAFRDYTVTITAPPQGPRYSVRAPSGTLLSENLSEDQLLAAHPKLHSDIHSSYASSESGNFIWAGRSESLIEPAVDAITNPD
jgi:hypothetical protein